MGKPCVLCIGNGLSSSLSCSMYTVPTDGQAQHNARVVLSHVLCNPISLTSVLGSHALWTFQTEKKSHRTFTSRQIKWKGNESLGHTPKTSRRRLFPSGAVLDCESLSGTALSMGASVCVPG